ncbi:hypothetical protein DM163_25240 [Escherichia coli]|jgi:hypothetical protein|nr:hypothetical protein [Escherichia coli]MJE63986.1 hypothetical protein [Escherichia coli]PPE22651.1 hypothetical protein C4Y10_26830 [Escherichia coli]GCP14329.1 hypothetical protein ExPECSC012_05088 [Escherichia coli]GCV14292.1 hypothetical protein HmCmsJML028_04881 [Escherichia coli]
MMAMMIMTKQERQNDLKTNVLKVRFSDAELSALKQRAANAGCSMSELVRNYAGKIQIKNRQDERERTIVLNRLNANLNMIAKWANTYNAGLPAVEVISHLVAIERSIRELDK